MSCTVSIASSPAFSPARAPLACKTSPETSLTPPPYHLHAPDGFPSSPFRPRIPRGASALRAFSKDAADASPTAGLEASPTVGETSGGGATLLKRKRPARIDIPTAEALASPPPPPESDGRRSAEVEGAGFAVMCKRGKRRAEMEDRHHAEVDLCGDPQMAFFGVFDGHGGAKAADFASRNMSEIIVDELMKRGRGLEEAVRNGYLKTDEGFLKEEGRGGTCCVTAFLRNGDLVVSNAGDCRAVLSRGGTAEALTSDHKPSREDERDRIESLGGYVDYTRGVCRLQGTLAVSRGIGDAHLKQWVIAEPETKTLRIRSEHEFLILASDGLWDKVSNQEAVDIARPLCTHTEKLSVIAACRKLADLSATRGSTDDISVMIIQLGRFV